MFSFIYANCNGQKKKVIETGINTNMSKYEIIKNHDIFRNLNQKTDTLLVSDKFGLLEELSAVNLISAKVYFRGECFPDVTMATFSGKINSIESQFVKCCVGTIITFEYCKFLYPKDKKIKILHKSIYFK